MDNRNSGSHIDQAPDCTPTAANRQKEATMSANKNDKLATEQTLIHFRNELKSDVASLDLKIVHFKDELKADIASLGSKIEAMNAKTERTLALYEQTRYEIKFISESNYQNSLAIDELKNSMANKIDIL